jgi:hypothetical protein
VAAGITQWVDMNVNRWDIGLQTTFLNVTSSLTKIVKGKTIWWYDAVSIGIIVMLIYKD